MDNLYLETFSKPDEQGDGVTLVPLETLVPLFLLSYCDDPHIKVTLVLTERKPGEELSGFPVRCHHEWLPLASAPHAARSCEMPVVVMRGGDTCVAGLCAVLRQIVKSAVAYRPSHEAASLLGFREGCLMACAEVSTWTRFCEVDIIRAVKELFNIPSLLYSPVTFPSDIARFEVHMSQPLRIHNVQKIKQDHAKLRDSSKTTELEHCFAEGPSMTLSDMILFPCIFIVFQTLQSVYLRQYLPLVHKWYDLMMEQAGVERALSVIANIESKIADDLYVKYIIPNVPNQSLYKSDPRRYRPKDRQFTRQDELDESLLLVPGEPEWGPRPFGWDVEFDWGAVPPEAQPQGGQLPATRLERKGQQLENLAKAVLKLARTGDVIVDFCSGAGHLGIILAHFLPRCRIILLENKEESLRRARQRVLKLNLNNVSFYQCNLDYFKGVFNIGVSLHACGVATDLVIQRCIQQSAAFVSCPCCYGSVQDNHVLSYPRSQRFRDTAMTLREYLVIGHSADQTHDEQNHKTSQGRRCMGIIDMDRCLQAKEAGYQVFMARLVPETCTPKNNLLVGVPHLAKNNS